MIEIKDLLAKYEKLLFSEESKRESVRQAVSETIGVSLKPEDIRIKNGTVYLDLKPIYKNELLLKKEKILEKIGRNITAVL